MHGIFELENLFGAGEGGSGSEQYRSFCVFVLLLLLLFTQEFYSVDLEYQVPVIPKL